MVTVVDVKNFLKDYYSKQRVAERPELVDILKGEMSSKENKGNNDNQCMVMSIRVAR